MARPVNGLDPTELRKYLDQRATGVDKVRSIGDKTGVVRIGDRFGMGAEAVRDELAKVDGTKKSLLMASSFGTQMERNGPKIEGKAGEWAGYRDIARQIRSL